MSTEHEDMISRLLGDLQVASSNVTEAAYLVGRANPGKAADAAKRAAALLRRVVTACIGEEPKTEPVSAPLVREIQQVYQERLLRPTESAVITPQEVDRYQASRYRVTTVIPLVEKPIQNTYVFDQDALDSFLEGYEEYAEFIVAIEKV